MSVKYQDGTEEQKHALERQTLVLIRSGLDIAHKISTPNTPKKTGRLRRNIKKAMIGGKGQISWDQPYAIYQESIQYQNYTTPGTGPLFAEDAMTQVSEQLDLLARKAYADWNRS